MVEAGGQVGGGTSVVLGRPQHDDRLGRAGIVMPRRGVDLNCRDRQIDDDPGNHEGDQPEGETSHPGPASRIRSSAVSSRAIVFSRPRTSMDSNSGGPTLRPVTATLTGAWAFASLRPWLAPASSMTARMSPAVQGHRP